MRSVKFFSALIALLLAVGCGDVDDDLLPSNDDLRPEVVEGTIGPYVGQLAPDFIVDDSLGTPVSLSDQLLLSRAVVLYFTMWCPVCDSHMSHMLSGVIPANPDVAFFAVDYVSGTLADVRSAQVSHGFDVAGVTALADLADVVEDSYLGTMSTTVVIDSAGVVRMNESYRDGSNLEEVLAAIP